MQNEHSLERRAGNKKKRGLRILFLVLLSLIAAALIAGVILAVLLLQDNVSHKYSLNPSLDALTKAVVELGAKDELTLTPQEMTDTVAYFVSEEVVDGQVRYKDIYFDVAEDQEHVLVVVPFRYGTVDLVMRMNASIAVRALSDTERYFVLTVREVRIGEVVIPPALVDRHIRKMKKADYVRYVDGEILVDASFLSLDVMGKKMTFQVRELSVVPEGFHIKTESLSDFLISVISEYFTKDTGLREDKIRSAIEAINNTLGSLEGKVSPEARETVDEIKRAMVAMLADPDRRDEEVERIRQMVARLGQDALRDVEDTFSRYFDSATAKTVGELFGFSAAG